MHAGQPSCSWSRYEEFSVLNILYILPGGELSETTVYLRDLLATVDREASQLHVWLMQDGPVRALFQTAGVETRVLSEQHSSAIADISLNGELQALRPDLVHITDERLLRIGIDCKRAGFPVIWHLHPNNHLGWQAPRTRDTIARYADGAILSRGAERLNKSLPAISMPETLNMEVIETACNQRLGLRIQAGVEADGFLIGLVVPDGDTGSAGDFIRAAGKLLQALPDTYLRFMLVALGGTRKESQQFEREVRRMAYRAGIEDDFLLETQSDDPLALIGSFDLLVMPPLEAGFYGLACKAMACGIPLITTIHNLDETLLDGDTALVIPAHNENALAEAALRLLREPDLRETLIKNARASCQTQYAARQSAKKLENFEREVLQH
jgi:hypothetical protein